MVSDKNFKVKMIFSVLAIIVSILYIALTYSYRKEIGWWAFIDCFALFMASFLWMMSIAVGRIIPLSGKTIGWLALGAFLLFVVSLVVEFVMYNC